MVDRSVLTTELEAALLRELRELWRSINESYFRGALEPPIIELHGEGARLGSWTPETRTLSLKRSLCLDSPWGAVVEILKHEMAHQYVHEIVGAVGETAHGKEFRALCVALGIDGRASGMPAATTTPEEARVAERIAKLLALAESPNLHEAEAAMLAAQRLMLRHQLDARDVARTADHGFRHLGSPTGRTSEADRILSLILQKHFFVEVIWVPVYVVTTGKRAHVLEVCGRETSLAIAEYVHGFLGATAARLWEDHKRAHGIGSNRDRRAFLAGVMRGVDDRLSRERQRQARHGLVWVKDGEISAYIRRRHPHVRHVRYGASVRPDAYGEGRSAGRRVDLRPGVGPGSSAGTPPKLLGPR